MTLIFSVLRNPLLLVAATYASSSVALGLWGYRVKVGFKKVFSWSLMHTPLAGFYRLRRIRKANRDLVYALALTQTPAFPAQPIKHWGNGYIAASGADYPEVLKKLRAALDKGDLTEDQYLYLRAKLERRVLASMVLESVKN